MSTFACGGGSSMGYNLAGYDVIAANDIDPEMAWHYKNNLNPKHYFLCPIKDLMKKDLPQEIFGIDVLDGSPPCSTFSMAGKREKNWGKKKKFREGQAEQVLSDLFFDFISFADYIKPKVIVAENVKGIILGNSKGYVREIKKRFKEIGYNVQIFLLNSKYCGVPQSRERVFFCCLRNDFKFRKLKLKLSGNILTAGYACSDIQELTDEEIKTSILEPKAAELYPMVKKGTSFQFAHKKKYGSGNYFGYQRLSEYKPAPTLLTKSKSFHHWDKCRLLTFREFKRIGSFPDDYQAKSINIGKYMVGMSVPPRMIEKIAIAIKEQWLYNVST
jgi:DNA (cytosine-5)-methyltransferase 1